MTDPRVFDELAKYRKQFPILAETTYLNSNSMGAMPAGAHAALGQYCDLWAREGVEAWHQWADVIDETADSIARFFEGGRGHTTLNQNVAFFQASVASSIDWNRPRNKVVIEQLQFPNVVYVWDRFRSLGANLELVPSDDGITIPLERMLEAIDETTAVVSISHGIYVSGALQDVAAICRRAHEVGALVVVDVYQTLGTVPFTAADWDADFIVGGSHKWLCGGPGTAFMWVKPGLRPKLEPRTTGWMAHAEPFAFAPAPICYANTSWRFMGGTPSVAAYYVARHAFQTLHEIGIETIRAHNLALCRMVIDRALEAGLTVHSPQDDDQRTGFVAIDFPGSERASQRLVVEGFKHDWRPHCGLRIGPHFYNTPEEVHRMMDRVVELAQR